MRLTRVAIVALSMLSAPALLVAQSWGGTYQMSLPTGAAQLTLQEAGGNVTGTLVTADGTTYSLTGAVSETNQGPAVVGRASGPALTGFAFQAVTGGYQFSFAPLDPSGVPRIDPNLVFPASRVGAQATPSTPPPPPTVDESLDARLLGLWSTQAVMNSEVGSVATELRWRFDPDGRLYDLGSRAVGLGIDTGPMMPQSILLWRAEGNVLYVSQGNDVWVPLAQYDFTSGRMHLFYPSDGSRQVWSPVR
ncbi:MAG: hypothetical protein AAF389_05510 [Gemmatimonadota bacterium]